MKTILIAGMGNLLRRDDGFGVEVARRLQARQLPQEVRLIEIGIGGLHLVQELMSGYQALVLIDAVDRGGHPGKLHVLEAEVPDITSWPAAEQADFLADSHYATPSKALMLAKALHILPQQVFIVGCQPLEVDEPGIGLSEPVALAADKSIGVIEAIVGQIRGGSR